MSEATVHAAPSYGRWVAMLALAEAAGIALVAVAYAAVDRGLIAPAAAAILGAGAWEGLCLGTAQAVLLARLGASRMLWIALTVVGAVAGYALSLLAGAGGADGGASPAAWLMLLAGAGAGAGMGLLLATIQLPALPNSIRRSAWVWANVLGWMPAMAAIMGAATLAGPGWRLVTVASLGAAAGAVAGASVGLFTGIALPRAHRSGAAP